MFNKLTYSVTFPSTGRTLSGDVDFHEGFGVITGANEQGKSFIIEVARFCFFGSAALRGKAEDYKTLKAKFNFTVRDVEYTVQRSAGTAKLWVGETQLAVGTKPVNEAIIKALGFGMEVFDVTCVANQGDVERLSTMKPTERKKMIDDVIGLTKLEDTGRWAGQEALAYERAIPEVGVAPTEPAAFDHSLLEAAKAAHDELQHLNGVLSVQRAEPVAPVCKISTPLVELEALAAEETEAATQVRVLEDRLNRLPAAPIYTIEMLDHAEAAFAQKSRYEDKLAFMKRHPHTEYHLEQLRVMLDDWTVWEQKLSLQQLVKELKSHGEVECPHCDHEFYLESGKIDEFEDRLNEMVLIDVPKLSRSQITTEIARCEDWVLAATQNEWERLKDAEDIEAPLTGIEISKDRAAHEAGGDRRLCESQLVEGRNTLHRIAGSGALRSIRVSYEAARRVFEGAHQEYVRHVQNQSIARARAVELRNSAESFPRIDSLRREWERYEDQRVAHTLALSQADDLRTKAVGWRAAQTALNNLRTMVKGHLVPALSRVASGLIGQMTNGQRSLIEVDQDFNVLVDGQSIDTLSGSGKAVANLALRLGLGQVLTNNVFSVFIGDEIDASMDEARAAGLAECVRSLVSRISQIILITHKYPSAEWHLQLGEKGEGAGTTS